MKKGTNCIKNNQAAGTDLLCSESVYTVELENKDLNCEQNEREKKVHQMKKFINCSLCRKGEKMNCTHFVGSTLYLFAY